MKEIKLILDRERKNAEINQMDFLQGNPNFKLVVSLYNDGDLVSVDSSVNPIIRYSP